jgi:hypothetical protein
MRAGCRPDEQCPGLVTIGGEFRPTVRFAAQCRNEIARPVFQGIEAQGVVVGLTALVIGSPYNDVIVLLTAGLEADTALTRWRLLSLVAALAANDGPSGSTPDAFQSH